jgi:hypothetical protein
MRLLPRIAQLIAVAVENALIREALVREKEKFEDLTRGQQYAGYNPRSAEAFSRDFRFYSQDDPA